MKLVIDATKLDSCVAPVWMIHTWFEQELVRLIEEHAESVHIIPR